MMRGTPGTADTGTAARLKWRGPPAPKLRELRAVQINRRQARQAGRPPGRPGRLGRIAAWEPGQGPPLSGSAPEFMLSPSAANECVAPADCRGPLIRAG